MIPARIAALAIMLAVASSATAQDHGIPVPEGALRNAALGGATTLATGKNYTIIVYDVESPLASVSEFYASRFPDAKRTAEGEEVSYQTNEGAIRIVRLGAGTRITLTVGPR
jgi:hypothetical protein